MIACFLSNISAKYYKNPSMLSRVIAKNVGDVFFRHSVVSKGLLSFGQSMCECVSAGIHSDRQCGSIFNQFDPETCCIQ